MNLSVILLQLPKQPYHEYHPEYIITQPWNAISSLVFFIPIIYWIWKLKSHYRQYPVMTAILPLLFLNGVGSTLYHTFEPNLAFALLDGIPPMLMVIVLSSYFWTKTTNSWWSGMLIVSGCYGVNILMAYILYTNGKAEAATNVTYFITGLTILAPVVFILARSRWKQWKVVALAILLLNIALLFRVLDSYEYPTNPFAHILPQGTHFLWHIVSAAAVFPLGRFIVHLRYVDTRPLEAYA